MIGKESERLEFRDLDLAGFAQEFLRRNPAYGREYRKIMHRAGDGGTARQEEMAHRWGLSFPLPD